MTAKNMLRVAIPDEAHAIDIACSDVEFACGLPVRAEFQEIEGSNLIIELQVGDETEPSPHPSRLSYVVDETASRIEVLSSWRKRLHSSRLLGIAPTSGA